MSQKHQIICSCNIYVQAVTYQESLNHWSKRRLRYIKNRKNSITWGSVEQVNAEYIFSGYIYIVLPDGE